MVPASSNPYHSYETVNRVDDWFPWTQMHQGQEIAVASTKPLTSLGRNGFQTIEPKIRRVWRGLKNCLNISWTYLDVAMSSSVSKIRRPHLQESYWHCKTWPSGIVWAPDVTMPSWCPWCPSLTLFGLSGTFLAAALLWSWIWQGPGRSFRKKHEVYPFRQPVQDVKARLTRCEFIIHLGLMTCWALQQSTARQEPHLEELPHIPDHCIAEDADRLIGSPRCPNRKAGEIFGIVYCHIINIVVICYGCSALTDTTAQNAHSALEIALMRVLKRTEMGAVDTGRLSTCFERYETT